MIDPSHKLISSQIHFFSYLFQLILNELLTSNFKFLLNNCDISLKLCFPQMILNIVLVDFDVYITILDYYRFFRFQMNRLTHQVCLIGAGPVGLTLANCLARSPFVSSIALIDKKIPSILKQPYKLPNQRVYSINGPTLEIFKSLEIQNQIRQFGQMKKIQVISKESQCFLQWQQNRAIIAQNDQIMSVLLSSIKENQKLSKKVQLIDGQLSQFVVSDDFCQIKLNNGKHITSSLLVGSDGNKSKVKELSKIPTYGWSYRQRAIVCTLKINQSLKSQNNSGYQIYYEGNVLAVLPLWENYVSIVWSLQISQFQHIMQKSDQDFLKILNSVLQNSNQMFSNDRSYRNIPKIQEVVNKRLSFPLSSLQAGSYTSQRIALVGDAAHSIHPMAGLGVNSGIIDSVLLANNIIENKKTGNDIGEHMALSKFESKSKSFNYSNSLAMQAIKKTFQINNPIVNIARKIGMNTFQKSSLIKSQMKNLVQNNPLIQMKPFLWQF